MTFRQKAQYILDKCHVQIRGFVCPVRSLKRRNNYMIVFQICDVILSRLPQTVAKHFFDKHKGKHTSFSFIYTF